MIVRFDQISWSRFNADMRLATVVATITSGKIIAINNAIRSVNFIMSDTLMCKDNE